MVGFRGESPAASLKGEKLGWDVGLWIGFPRGIPRGLIEGPNDEALLLGVLGVSAGNPPRPH